MTTERERKGVLQAINTPLGFYVLALLIVEGFLGVVTGLGPDTFVPVATGLGVGMFVLIVACVTVVVWRRPESLTLTEQSYQERFRIEKTSSLDDISVDGGDWE